MYEVNHFALSYDPTRGNLIAKIDTRESCRGKSIGGAGHGGPDDSLKWSMGRMPERIRSSLQSNLGIDHR
jgi:hypothetical protein